MSVFGDILGWFLILGGFATYYFQIRLLVKRKSVEGLNRRMLLLGCVSCYTNLLGIIGLNSRTLFSDCDGYECFSNFLPIIQIFSPWICYEVIYLLYLKYDQEFRQYENIILHISYLFFTIFLLVLVQVSSNKPIYSLSIIYNVISGILSVLMWIPQVITTYYAKSPGSLSLWSIGTHGTGCILIIIYQCALEKQNFVNILSYLFSAIFEFLILGYCLCYIKYPDKPILNIQGTLEVREELISSTIEENTEDEILLENDSLVETKIRDDLDIDTI